MKSFSMNAPNIATLDRVEMNSRGAHLLSITHCHPAYVSVRKRSLSRLKYHFYRNRCVENGKSICLLIGHMVKYTCATRL